MAITPEDLRAAVPDFTGTIDVEGLERPVEILRDAQHVPHIRAASSHDAFFAQGFAHAQDRLWQMDYDRRRAAGRWAEYAGRGGIAMDTLMRRLRLVESARADYDAFNAETRAMLDAYAAGVNAFIATTPVLPAEYRLVGGAPEPWRPWDCCAVFLVRHAMMGSWSQKLWRTRQLRAVGPEALMHLRAGTAVGTPVVVPTDADYVSVPDGAAENMLVGEAIAGLWEWGAGSNNWALGGASTASGKPLVAGDPHRQLEVPNVYYQNHLTCPDWDVIGHSFAGAPGFPHFGHNERAAWCITHAGTDGQDLYLERFAPGDPGRYEYRGEWRAAERATETIRVRGADPVAIDVTITHHGPIVVGDPAKGYAVALRYNATAARNGTLETLLPTMRARTVAELDESMRAWVDPGNNLVMADVDGNIGYLLRGQLPLRGEANGWLPVPGWTGEHEWRGHIPFEELPRSHNPAAGYIATANNRIVGDGYPYYLALDYAPPYRADRIIGHLRALTRATVADMAAIHTDKFSTPSRVFVGMLDQVAPRDDASAEAKRRLQAWDGTMGPESSAATLYAVWREQTIGLLLQAPALRPLTTIPAGEKPPGQPVILSPRVRGSLLALMQQGDTAPLPEGETWPTLLAESLARATAWLAEQLGPDMDAWRWDRIHRTAPKHVLAGAFPDLAELLNPPSVGVGGDGDTPQVGGYLGIEGNTYAVTSTSVTRYVFDLADWDRSAWVVPLGSSGHPGSPHYADQVAAWGEQQLFPMAYTGEAVDRAARARQRLEPGT